jgi:hypothetical protein
MKACHEISGTYSPSRWWSGTTGPVCRRCLPATKATQHLRSKWRYVPTQWAANCPLRTRHDSTGLLAGWLQTFPLEIWALFGLSLNILVETQRRSHLSVCPSACFNSKITEWHSIKSGIEGRILNAVGISFQSISVECNTNWKLLSKHFLLSERITETMLLQSLYSVSTVSCLDFSWIAGWIKSTGSLEIGSKLESC